MATQVWMKKILSQLSALLRKIMPQWIWLAAGTTSTGDDWVETSKTTDREKYSCLLIHDPLYERMSSWGKDLVAALF